MREIGYHTIKSSKSRHKKLKKKKCGTMLSELRSTKTVVFRKQRESSYEKE